MGMGWSFGRMNYSEEWRQRRKIFHHYYSASAVEKYEGIILENVYRFLLRLRDRPENFFGHARLFVFSLLHNFQTLTYEQCLCCDASKCDLWYHYRKRIK